MNFYYHPSLLDKLKIQFNGIDRVTRNFSANSQDMFVLSVLNGKENGTYLEIGASVPIDGNNTYILENQFGWKGASVEYLEGYVNEFRGVRTNPVYHQNALTTDYDQLLTENGLGPIIDYLSCDIEPQEHTFAALQKIPHDKYRFRVITFEHDHYNGGEGPRVREESRKYLADLGYELVVADASDEGNKIEDWWVAPELVDRDVIDRLKEAGTYNHHESVYKLKVPFEHKIFGWFSYDYIYRDMVSQADDDSLFVEIGSFKGKSTAFMTVEIANSGKNIRFECIDPMKLMGHYAESAKNENEKEIFAGYSEEEFHARLASVSKFYKLHAMTSEEAVNLYEDGSIDFLMVDGDHSYEGVKKDIELFLPKMRSGGLIAGDDAFAEDVVRAVQDIAGHLNPEFNGIHFFISIP
jgi:predicted O-methyltransferase YrrM